MLENGNDISYQLFKNRIFNCSEMGIYHSIYIYNHCNVKFGKAIFNHKGTSSKVHYLVKMRTAGRLLEILFCASFTTRFKKKLSIALKSF